MDCHLQGLPQVDLTHTHSSLAPTPTPTHPEPRWGRDAKSCCDFGGAHKQVPHQAHSQHKHCVPAHTATAAAVTALGGQQEEGARRVRCRSWPAGAVGSRTSTERGLTSVLCFSWPCCLPAEACSQAAPPAPTHAGASRLLCFTRCCGWVRPSGEVSVRLQLRVCAVRCDYVDAPATKTQTMRLSCGWWVAASGRGSTRVCSSDVYCWR